MRRSTRLTAAVLVLSALSIAACANKAAPEEKTRALTPADFAAAGPPVPASSPKSAAEPAATPAPGPNVSSTQVTAHAASPTPAAAAPPASNASASTAPAETGDPQADRAEVKAVFGDLPAPSVTATPRSPGDAFTVDGMVGQVNGQAIYASRVLKPIEPQLQQLGAQVPRVIFRQRVTELIARTLEQIVFDSLMLGEGERDLSQQEQMGLTAMLRDKREELLRRYGRGSLAVAEQRLTEETGQTLEQTLDDHRSRVLVSRYMQKKMLPRINIARKDVERYYRDNHEKFNPPAGRKLRLIVAPDAAAAKKVQQQLDEGKPFVEVASDAALNRNRPDEAGMFAQAAKGDTVFGQEALNNAMLSLTAGQHSPRIDIGERSYWVYLESISEGKERPLREVQLEIEDTLRRQKYQQLTQQYRRDLFQTGSYNPIDDMTAALVDIAVNRYAQPQ